MEFSLTQIAIDMIDSAGYGGLALGLIVDSAGVPIPSEVLIPAGAILAKQGEFSLPVVIVVCTLAQTLGAAIAYFIGRYGAEPVIEKYGKYFLISKKDLRYTHRQFEKHGQLIAFTGRCIPIVRGYIGFVAGIGEMSFRRFMVASFLGSLAWTLILVAAGYMIADNVEVIEETLRPFSILIALGIVIAVAVFIRHRLKEYR